MAGLTRPPGGAAPWRAGQTTHEGVSSMEPEPRDANAKRYLDILGIWQEEAIYLAEDLGSPGVRELIERVNARIAELK